MRIVFYAADKPREIMLAKALAEGAAAHGDTLEIRRTAEYGEDQAGNDLAFPGPTPDTDVACMFGVKGRSRQILQDHRTLKITTLFLDKGYTREKGEGGHTLYTRVSVNAAHPLDYMLREKRTSDRWKRLGLKIGARAPGGGHVLVCTSSQKYCEFHELGDLDQHASRLLSEVARRTERQVIYRPKPSRHDAMPIGAAAFSGPTQPLAAALRGCHCLVTHGTSAAMYAILAGVPAIVLGEGIARPVAGQSLDAIDDPVWKGDEERYRWACAVAYCQWTTEELRSGEAWAHLKAEILHQRGSA
jgi:hypothetical protein